jgi:hypothetical protein
LKVYSGFKWLRIGSNGRLLWIHLYPIKTENLLNSWVPVGCSNESVNSIILFYYQRHAR